MSRKELTEGYSIKSYLIHGRFFTKRWDFDHHLVPPLSSSSTYRLESAQRGAMGFNTFADVPADDDAAPVYIYDRLDEPTRSMLEDQMAAVEGGEMALCFQAGMAAISGALCVLAAEGKEVVSHRVIYGCTHSLLASWLPRFGIRTTFVDMKDLESVRAAINDNVRVLYIESPANPTLELIDIAAIRKIADEVNQGRSEEEQVWVVVDNTFATPACQRPLEHGAHVVVHSLTKNICGFGTDMGGVVIGPKRIRPQLLLFRKDFGSMMVSKSAWPIMVYGLPTLDLRMRKQEKNARDTARFLEEHPKVGKVHYPGLESFPQRELAKRQMRNLDDEFAPGNMVYFCVAGSPQESFEKGKALVDYIAQNAYAMTLAVSLGNIRTLIEMPSSMTHALVPEDSKADGGIDVSGIRLSMGIEDTEDILRDLRIAIDACC